MFQPRDKIGPYSLLQKIGRGAFGEVWLAEERTAISTHTVALKLPNNEEVNLEAIRQEATVWEEVKGHPNILPIIKADIADGQIYIASEFAPDGSLSRWLKLNGGKAPDTETAIKMIRGVLSGLGHLHSKGIVHRDLKPENILLQAETPRIADFGIARLIQATSNSTMATGTPTYMAPECFYGTRSAATDLWAVAVIFHLLLTGKQVFPQPDQVSVMNAIINGEPLIDTSIPETFRNLIIKALQRDPDNRFASATEMIAALNGDAFAYEQSRRFNSFKVSTQPPQDNEIETRVIDKVSTPTLRVFKGDFVWKISAAALSILLVAMLSVWAGMRFLTNQTSTVPRSRTEANVVSDSTAQPVVPIKSADIKDPQALTSTDMPTADSLPGGDGYNAWAPQGAPPAVAAPTIQPPPVKGRATTNDNDRSQFMPPSGPIQFVRKDILTGICTTMETREVVPCPDGSSARPLAVPPGKKPPANVRPTPTRKTPTPEKTITDDCRYNGKCN